MRASALLSVFFCFLIPSICLSQDPPAPFTKIETRSGTGWNAGLKIVVVPSVHAVAQGNDILVTGTNINLKLTPTFVDIVSYPNMATINWMKLKIGGEVVHQWTLPETAVVHEVRFASTHFADAASKDIVLEGEFHGWTTENPAVEFTETFSATVPVTIYNKAIGLTTVEEWIQTVPGPPEIPGHYSKPGDGDYPNPANVADTAKRIVDDAIVKLTGSAMKHTMVPGNSDGRAWRESTSSPRLDEKMCLATLFFACTHGEVSLWRATHTDELTYSPAASNDVKTYVTTGPGDPRPPRDVPDYTLAFFYSCETLYNSNNNPLAFQIPHPSSYPNKGFAGFTGHVDHRLFYPTGEFLDEHSKKVLDYMVLGDPLKVALDKVQDPNTKDRKYPMVRTFIGTGSSLLMVTRGDPYARIVNVYLNESEWNAASQEVRNNWFWVKS